MSPKKQRPAKSSRGQRPAKRQAPPPAGARRRPASQPAAGRQPAGQRPSAFYTPGGSPLRHSVERASAPLLIMLRQLPRPVIMFTPLALFLLGAFLPVPWAYIALGLFFLLTFWLAYLSWPSTDSRGRVIRVVMFAVVIALLIVRAVR